MCHLPNSNYELYIQAFISFDHESSSTYSFLVNGTKKVCFCMKVLTEVDWQVMLFGHDDKNIEDKGIRVTVAFNHFGSGLVQRMPRSLCK